LPLQGKILEMLRQRMPSGLQHENSVAVGLVGIEMPRQHAVKAPDDESVEKSSVALRLGRRPVVVHTVHGFVEAIADVSAENVLGEIRELRGLARGHVRLRFSGQRSIAYRAAAVLS
jgi:hypothetical protein